MVKTYDPASYDLAKHFLQDDPMKEYPQVMRRLEDDLAKHIQQAVEDWFYDHSRAAVPDQRSNDLI